MKVHFEPGVAYKIKNGKKEPVKEMQAPDCNCGFNCCEGKFYLGSDDRTNVEYSGNPKIETTYWLQINDGVLELCYETKLDGKVEGFACNTIIDSFSP